MQEGGAVCHAPSSTTPCVGPMAPRTPTSASWTSTTAGYGAQEAEASTSSRMASAVVSVFSLLVMISIRMTNEMVESHTMHNYHGLTSMQGIL